MRRPSAAQLSLPVTDYVDPLELGPLLLSLVGVLATLAAFVALQRYLARRVPARRVRKAECPFCGYPGRRPALRGLRPRGRRRVRHLRAPAPRRHRPVRRLRSR
ncbi:MAG: hypothetical protein WD067_01055 [Gaiellaceae bacterium]